MENMTQKAFQMGVADEIKVAADEIKVATEMGWAATEPDALASSGRLYDAFKQTFQRNLQNSRLRLLHLQRNLSSVEYYIDLESGLKTKKVACKCCWVDKCPKCDGYGRSANDRIERIVKELKDKDNALKFIPTEMVKKMKENGYALMFIPVVKELNDEDYGLLCTHVDFVKELKDDGYFIPVEPVEVSKDDDCALKLIPVEMVRKLKEAGYALFIPVERAKKLKDEDNVKMGSGGKMEEEVNKSWLKKCAACLGYANDYIEKTVKPEMGILFSAGTMQNIGQIATSEMVNTGKGKTLMKLNEAAFMMLLYGLVMPRRAAGNFALAIGVALSSAAYLFTMSFAF